MQVLTPARFKSMIRDRKSVPGDILLRKEALGVAELVSDRTLRFVLSTAAVDREYDLIDQNGWDLDAYKQNPVVLLNHAHDGLPIGKMVDIGTVGGALRGTVEFVPADVPIAGPFAEAVLRLCQGGFMSATSVGFRPLEWSVPEGDAARGERWWPGVDYTRQELCELSIVTVPCNPEALIDELQSQAQPDRVDPAIALAFAATAKAAAARRRTLQLLALA